MLLKSDLDYLINQRDELNQQIRVIKSATYASTNNFIVKADPFVNDVCLRCYPTYATEKTQARIIAMGGAGNVQQQVQNILADVTNLITQLQSIEEQLRNALE